MLTYRRSRAVSSSSPVDYTEERTRKNTFSFALVMKFVAAYFYTDIASSFTLPSSHTLYQLLLRGRAPTGSVFPLGGARCAGVVSGDALQEPTPSGVRQLVSRRHRRHRG
jgi:hypothetical protein